MEKAMHALFALVGVALVEVLQFVSPVEPPVFDNPGFVRVFTGIFFVVIYVLYVMLRQTKLYNPLVVYSAVAVVLVAALAACVVYYTAYNKYVAFPKDVHGTSHAIVVTPILSKSGICASVGTCTPDARPPAAIGRCSDPCSNISQPLSASCTMEDRTASRRCVEAIAAEQVQDDGTGMEDYMNPAAFEAARSTLRLEYLLIVILLVLGIGIISAELREKLAG